MTGATRRQFLGAVGAGAAASAGVPAGVAAHGTDGDPAVVSMHADYFDPVGLHVEPGDTVRFEVAAGSHSATAYPDRVPEGADAFDSGVRSDGSFEHAFEVPGTYDHYCVPHRAVGMVGRIVVGEPGGPAEESPLPDGEVPDGEAIVEQGAIGHGQFRGDAGGEFGGDGGGGPMGHGRRGRGGMMGNSRSGTGGPMGAGPGWMLLLPAGLLTTVVGATAGAAYWATRRSR